MIPKKTSLFILLFVFSFLIANPALSQKTLKVGGVISSSGKIKSGFINVPAGSDGPEIRIPITVVNRKKKGPVLALASGIHGYEYPPILALQRLGRDDPQGLRGGSASLSYMWWYLGGGTRPSSFRIDHIVPKASSFIFKGQKGDRYHV